MKVLKLSAQGLPQSWISLEQAVLHYAADQVRWEAGADVAVFRGGINARSGLQSVIRVNSIIGVWLLIAPWLLSFPAAARVNAIAVGLVLLGVSLLGGRTEAEMGGGWRAIWQER